jgi:hypothetical protein
MAKKEYTEEEVKEAFLTYNRLAFDSKNRSSQDEKRMKEIEEKFSEYLDFAERPALIFRVAEMKVNKKNQNNNTIVVAKNEKQNG